ncbi:helix-turn-helix transcriptional regulator [Actinoplanes solisilvae]|uniref:helix-turn-helix transcriptional regulator n=1 Tax=Actinoplanes solisilvae TaxID=2486853 RepID=UPI000FD8EDFF|nr:LuxR family transcriptional regulator [Actinoplanes solisilvae]
MTRLVGREGPLNAIAAVLARGGSVLVHGPRGAGRSAVLAEAARRRGGRVLVVRALPGDEALPGAGLHRLLRPVQRHTTALPPPAAAAFARLFGEDPPSAAPAEPADAVRALARVLPDCLWVADDLDRLDELSRSVLVGLDELPVLAGATTAAVAPEMTAVRLSPLSRTDAGRLVAALPEARGHPGARLVVAQSRGNPLALTELARHLPPAKDLPPTATELPVPGRLRRALAPGVDGLDPVRLRAALVVAFAAETPGRSTAAALDALVPVGVFDELAADGVLGTGWHFPHPVVRATVIDRAGPADRNAARLALAARLPVGDPAGAWHRARAEAAPDDEAAALLDRAGDRLSMTGRVRAAAYALGLASARSSDLTAARRRAERAAHHAHLAGEDAWSLALSAGRRSGEAHLLTTLRAAWMRGDGRSRERVREALRDGGAGESELLEAWGRALADDVDVDGRARRLLEQDGQPEAMPPDERAIALGTIALARHETEHAARHLTRAWQLAAPGGPHRPLALIALAWVHYDSARFDAATKAAVRALAEPSPARIAVDVRAGALALHACVAALRGEPDLRERLREARGAIQPVSHAVYDVRLGRAQGLADAIAGLHGLAFHRLRHQYPHGVPAHHRVSDLGLADLAQVAVVLDRQDQVAPIVAAAERRVRALESARLTAVWHRARALLATAEPEAEEHFRLALDDPDGARWPVERALTLMDYAQWLRRRHRPSESRPLLAAARDVFAATGMTPWEQRAEAELAAAAPPRRQAAGLTPQQREVVRLAAQGLTNKQIADRLALSDRTVGTHLSRAYPILGVARRSQLPAVIDRL